MTWLYLLRALPIIIRVAHRLARSDERRKLLRKLEQATGDGRMTQPEWVGCGWAAGVFTPRR